MQDKNRDALQSKSSGKGGSHVRKRKLRLDRIAAVLIPLLLIVVLIVLLCLYSCQRSGKLHLLQKSTTTTTEASQTTTTTTEEDTTPSTQTEATEAESALTGDSVSLPSTAVEKGNLILINNDHSYSFPVGDSTLETLYDARNSAYSVSDMTVQLESETIQQLNAMMEAFQEETGYTGMQVFSGYRSKEDQDDRYESGSTTFAGGYSDYHSGRSFNLKINFGDGTSDYYNGEKYPAYDWISEHAAEYGFVVRFPEEKDEITGEESRSYTFRYVGVPHAIYMTEHDLCLEEYLEEIQQYTQENPLEITVDDAAYHVYYVPETVDGNTEFTTDSKEYTISGDNVGGFVVTEEKEVGEW